VAFVATAYLTSSAGEDVTRIGLLLTSVVGGAAAMYVMPRLITPSPLSHVPLVRWLLRSLLLVLGIVVVLFAGLVVLTSMRSTAPTAPF
jgi:hypothetical protein